ncbi:MAG: hypothetical protein UHS32_11245 [Bacteroidaceae bacterium]|nr:hypothetical protein [Bacteroidaceae bacterium]
MYPVRITAIRCADYLDLHAASQRHYKCTASNKQCNLTAKAFASKV